MGTPMQPPSGPQNDTFYAAILGQEQGPMTYFDLQNLTRTGQLKPEMQVRTTTSSWFPVSQVPGLFSDKDWLTTVLISFFLGPWASTASGWATPVWASSSSSPVVDSACGR